MSEAGNHWKCHSVLIIACLVTLYPLAWVCALAFSGQQDLLLADLPTNPTIWDRIRILVPVPDHASLDNFKRLFADYPLGRWLFNSLVVAATTAVVGVMVACSAAYAFSRFKFPGQRVGLIVFLISQMYPSAIMLIPLYIIVVGWLGLGDQLLGLIIVNSVTTLPFCVWMLKGFFDTLPKDIEESALIDGASQGQIFFTIVLPLAKPALAVTGLFAFLTAWNEFIMAAVFMEDSRSYTIPVGLRFFAADYTSQWGNFAAGSIIVSLPVLLLFFYLQRFLVSGLTAGSVRG